MFERLAKFRSVVQWLKAPLSEPVYSQSIHSNDNRPGFRRPEGQGLRPHRALAYHWIPATNGRHLECRWELAATVDGLTYNRGQSPHLDSPPLVPDVGQITIIEQIAS